MDLDKSLKHVVTVKKGTIEELNKIIGVLMVDNLLNTKLIKISETNRREFQVSQTGINIYNSIYKKPSFLESLKGLYCHYILKI